MVHLPHFPSSTFDLQRSISSFTPALAVKTLFVFLFIASLNTINLVISFLHNSFTATIDFLVILALVLFCVSFPFIYSVFIDTAFSNPGSFFVQFTLKRRRSILRCVNFLPLLQFSFKSKIQKLFGKDK
jgi:hypothetical protein